MNIVVCAKLAPDTEDLEVKGDGSISTEKAEWIIGEYDLRAVEAGMKIVEESSGAVHALCAGPKEINNSKLKKDLLSRGPDDLSLVIDDGLKVGDTHLTATVLSQAVKKMGGVELVLCGEGSSDLYFQQVGMQLGEILGWPTINAVSKIQVEGNSVIVERSLEEEVEVLEVPLPAVLSVTTDINTPRLASMKEILKAGKKPVAEWSLSDIGVSEMKSGVDVVSTKAPKKVERKQIIIPGSTDEAVQALLVYLSKEGVL